MAFRPDGTALAAGDLNDIAYLWNLATRKIVERLQDPGGGGIYAVAFSPSGTSLAAADGDGDTYVWNLAKHAITQTLPDPKAAAGDYSVAFGRRGATIATVDGDGDTYLWNVATRKIIYSLRTSREWRRARGIRPLLDHGRNRQQRQRLHMDIQMKTTRSGLSQPACSWRAERSRRPSTRQRQPAENPEI